MFFGASAPKPSMEPPGPVIVAAVLTGTGVAPRWVAVVVVAARAAVRRERVGCKGARSGGFLVDAYEANQLRGWRWRCWWTYAPSSENSLRSFCVVPTGTRSLAGVAAGHWSCGYFAGRGAAERVRPRYYEPAVDLARDEQPPCLEHGQEGKRVGVTVGRNNF